MSIEFGTIRGLIEINTELIEIEERLETYGAGIKEIRSDLSDLREKISTLEEAAKEKKKPEKYFRGERFLHENEHGANEEFIVASYDGNLFLVSLVDGNYWTYWTDNTESVKGEPYTMDEEKLFAGQRDNFKRLTKSELA